jgi:hypothetical protein
MLFHLFLPFVTLLSTIAAVAFALPTTPLQDCSQTSPQPCECPAGTSYHTVTSYITLGVNAFDVRNLTADCMATLYLVSPLTFTRACLINGLMD